LKYQSAGASRLHVVDLDGAATGNIGNMDIIKNIVTALLIPVQVGGGIRDLETIGELLKAGVDRVILGTAAVENPSLVKEACHLYRESIIAGIDASEGKVATRGWVLKTQTTAVELAIAMANAGVRRFIYTDISRDGTLTEPNFAATQELIDTTGLPVIAAGGVTTINHLKILQKIGAEGAIIGRALYTGDIDLRQAILEMQRLI